MRELVIGVVCVFGLLILLSSLGETFDSSSRKPAHAMELAQVQAEANAAKAKAEQCQIQLEKAQAELKAATEANETLKKRVAELEAGVPRAK